MTLKLGTEIPGTSAEGNITTIWVPAIKNIKPRPSSSSRPAPTSRTTSCLAAGASTRRRTPCPTSARTPCRTSGPRPQERRRHQHRGHRQHEHGAQGTERGRHPHARGASGYIVRRRGMATDAPLASGQKLTVVSVKCGEKKVINRMRTP